MGTISGQFRKLKWYMIEKIVVGHKKRMYCIFLLQYSMKFIFCISFTYSHKIDIVCNFWTENTCTAFSPWLWNLLTLVTSIFPVCQLNGSTVNFCDHVLKMATSQYEMILNFLIISSKIVKKRPEKLLGILCAVEANLFNHTTVCLFQLP